MKNKINDLYISFFSREDGEFSPIKKIEKYISSNEDSIEIKKQILEILFSEILEILDNKAFYDFIKIIYSNEDLRYLLYKNANELLVEIVVLGVLNSDYTVRNLDIFLKALKESGYSIEKILEILEPYASKISKIMQINIVDLNLDYYTEEEKEKFKDFIEMNFNKNKREFVYNMVLGSLVSRRDCTMKINIEDIDEVYVTFFEKLLTELMKNEGVKYVDIKVVEKGYFCDVYKIGNKMLKIGIPKITQEIPNSKYLIQPLIRYNLPNKNGKEFLHVEVAECVGKVDLTNDDVYELYSKLREDGIKWADAKDENIGRLLKKNTNYLNGEEITINQTINGFDVNNTEVLGESELVVLDIDLLFKDDEEIKYDYRNMYEDLWEEEHKKTK
ncbi:MAG: hypothetical protein R3Y13_04285 [bacterium]